MAQKRRDSTHSVARVTVNTSSFAANAQSRVEACTAPHMSRKPNGGCTHLIDLEFCVHHSQHTVSSCHRLCDRQLLVEHIVVASAARSAEKDLVGRVACAVHIVREPATTTAT